MHHEAKFVIVVATILSGVKTAVNSLTRQTFQLNNSSLEILETQEIKDTTDSESLSAIAWHDSLNDNFFLLFLLSIPSEFCVKVINRGNVKNERR